MTAVYYTANRVNELFANKVRQALVEAAADADIVSVSQQPLTLGTNICVGDVGHSGMNPARAFSLGVKAAKTKYVCAVEDDTVYPASYYAYRPDRDDRLYLARPTWLVNAKRHQECFYTEKPMGFEGALVAERTFLLDCLREWLAGRPEWCTNDEVHRAWVHAYPKELWRIKRRPFTYLRITARFDVDVPILTFKTDNCLHALGRHNPTTTTTYLPPFGGICELLTAWYARF